MTLFRICRLRLHIHCKGRRCHVVVSTLFGISQIRPQEVESHKNINKILLFCRPIGFVQTIRFVQLIGFVLPQSYLRSAVQYVNILMERFDTIRHLIHDQATFHLLHILLGNTSSSILLHLINCQATTHQRRAYMKKKCIIFSIGLSGGFYSFREFYIVVPHWYQYCLGVDVPNKLFNFTINGNITVATNKE